MKIMFNYHEIIFFTFYGENARMWNNWVCDNNQNKILKGNAVMKI